MDEYLGMLADAEDVAPCGASAAPYANASVL
jgi:hypothetical protein